jgi:hypothetical protein
MFLSRIVPDTCTMHQEGSLSHFVPYINTNMYLKAKFETRFKAFGKVFGFTGLRHSEAHEQIDHILHFVRHVLHVNSYVALCAVSNTMCFFGIPILFFVGIQEYFQPFLSTSLCLSNFRTRIMVYEIKLSTRYHVTAL